jgi:hypothetical protein
LEEPRFVAVGFNQQMDSWWCNCELLAQKEFGEASGHFSKAIMMACGAQTLELSLQRVNTQKT